MSDQDKDKDGKGQGNKFEVTVSFGGVDKPLEVNKNQAVEAVFNHAMQLFHSPGGDLGLFIGATELQRHLSVEQAGITPGVKLLLRPRRSQGG